MLYRLINKKRDIWLSSNDCSIKPMIDYMEKHGKLRDAQLDAIKTYLFLKIACRNKPLWELMNNGSFNTISKEELDELPLKASSRDFLKNNPPAQALYEYAVSKDDNGISTSEKLAELIINNPKEIDYTSVIKSLFYGVEYPDYLFSIPMGAGKTWLMAAFIYIDLYFALNEPDNSIFAHNFIILAPAGLKSSIIPSLKNIQDFDPTFILPEPTASQIKSKLKYETLEEDNSAKSSNQIKNPNALKIQLHQPFQTLEGLVIITNAEKLYDRVDHSVDTTPALSDTLNEKERSEWLKTVLANELRQIIAKIPNLCIMIDEVHHASEEQLLRKVVEKWVSESTFNSVLGFSGTPYLSSPERKEINETLALKNSMLSNVVTYYPLVNAIGNFLKIPQIKSSDISSEDIIQSGVEEFLSIYKDTVYPKFGFAKLAIYCGSINTLETVVFPLVVSICQKFKLNPEDSILKYYRNNNKNGYTCPSDSKNRFRELDSEFSKTRIILLVQIGKEGWNCKSLTGVILPNENSSPKNMVLQTSCRCLREVINAQNENALIWLNKSNERKLDSQLQKEHHTSVAEIQKPINKANTIRRFSRQEIVKLPKLSYVQLHFSYSAISTEEIHTEQRLKEILPQKIIRPVIIEKKLDGSERIIGQSKNYESLQPMEYTHWLNLIIKESFFSISLSDLKEYDKILRSIFNSITVLSSDNIRGLNPEIAHQAIRSSIRKCFTAPTKIKFSKEAIPREAALLKVEHLSNPCYMAEDRIICPDEADVLNIINADKPQDIPEHIKTAIEILEAQHIHEAADQLRKQYATISDPINRRTYQYIPYSFDSNLENKYYLQILRSLLESNKKIEVYYNGDESLTEFYIDCYKSEGSFRKNIGKYYPDFLILRRNDKNIITKVILVETKGNIYENAFEDKKDFMSEFIAFNNEQGPTKFQFLYIPESMSDDEQYQSTLQQIKKFLND